MDYNAIGTDLSFYFRANEIPCIHWGDGVISIAWSELPDLRVVIRQGIDGAPIADIGALGEDKNGNFFDVDFALNVSLADFPEVASIVRAVVARFGA